MPALPPRLSLALGAWSLAAAVLAQPAAPAALPLEVTEALARAQVPPEAVSLVVQELGGPSRLAWQADLMFNPASLAKLVTTQAALELLGPAFRWRTPVWLTGPLREDGVLEGSVVIQGRGDPQLTGERLWQLLRKLRQMGVRRIQGDLVLDRSAFAPSGVAPGDFDGEPLRPANVQADALLLAFGSVQISFTPDPAAGVARISTDLPQDGVQVDREVPLAEGPCDDWRGVLQAELAEVRRIHFAGRYPAACGERVWPLASPDPAGHAARVLRGLWRELGGQLRGTVRQGVAPAQQPPLFELASPPLADVVRDINKHSNNVMAQQLFLTLALQQQPDRPATPAAARELLRGWISRRLGELSPPPMIDNGSGLSRDYRVSAGLLARLLQLAFDSPVMPELMSSLPVNGLDGTMRRSRSAVGRAHLKTGSLRDVAAIAGYLLPDTGRRLVLVAMINHPNASAARPALDALVQWAMRPAEAAR